MSKNYYKKGVWNCICDVCGGKFKSDELQQRWDGFMVCKSDFEHRHIGDFFRARGEHNNVKNSRPEPTDTFVSVVYLSDRSAIAGLAIAGLAISGQITI